jgi:hypothetical protein
VKKPERPGQERELIASASEPSVLADLPTRRLADSLASAAYIRSLAVKARIRELHEHEIGNIGSRNSRRS